MIAKLINILKKEKQIKNKSSSRLFEYTSGANQELVDELVVSGEKCTPENILGIVKDKDGKIVRLETGNERVGFNHILKKHEKDFEKQGVTTEELSTYVMEVIKQGNIVGQQGKGSASRTILEFIYEGKTRRIAIQISRNGFIVSANPKSLE